MTMDLSTRIGFIGLGKIGSPVAKRLAGAGYPLHVFDTRPEAIDALEQLGAERMSSAADVASACDVLIVSLPTPKVVEQVAMGEDSILKAPRCKIYIDISTTGPAVAELVEKALAARGIAVVDGPVSGGVGGATAGTLSIMTACSDALFEHVHPLLLRFGRPFHVGQKVGQGQMMKLVNNLLSGTALAITAEAFTIGVKAGLDPKTMLDVINVSSGKNDATLTKFPKSVLDRSFAYGFSSGLMHKDIDLCLSEAQRLGVPTYVSAAVRQMWLHTVTEFGEGSDFTNIVRCVEQWAGVQVGDNK
jgi:2-hydroxy-3-oxopropionate reductase